MALLVSTRRWTAMRIGACLLVAACSQAAFETYGCACDSRTYTAEEIAGYRAGAARGDLAALAQMEEYYSWRSYEHEDGSQAFEREDRQRQRYRDLRIAAKDPAALDEEADILMSAAAFDKLSPAQRLAALRKARAYVVQIPNPENTFDRKSPERGEIDPLRYIDREIALLERGRTPS